MKKPKCSVKGCKNRAVAEVILYDLYLDGDAEIFFEQDHTCPFICGEHLFANEMVSKGTRDPRGFVSYPYTNLQTAQGFTIYRPLESEK